MRPYPPKVKAQYSSSNSKNIVLLFLPISFKIYYGSRSFTALAAFLRRSSSIAA